MKIAHLADIHIRNNTRHDEYREVFKKLYESLEKERPDAVIIAGDIFHQKTELSSESVVLCTDFFLNISGDRGPDFFVIPGNHDYSKQNREKKDSVYSILHSLERIDTYRGHYFNQNKIHNTGQIKFYFHRENEFFKPEEIDPSTINIAIYHGTVQGSRLDNGYLLDSDTPLSYFKQFDFAMLGDIHKQQFLDVDERIGYCGSLIQQDISEDPERHGYLLWDIKSKDDWSCQFIKLDNPYKIITYEVFDDGSTRLTPEKSDSEKATLLIKLYKEHTQEELFVLLEDIKKKVKFNQYEIREYFKEKQLLQNIESENLFNRNYHEISVQNDALKSYLKDSSKDEVDEVLVLNKDINSKVKVKEQILKNQDVTIKKLKITNLFSYKKEQEIDLSGLTNKIIGINGKNASGKSSVVDILLWVLYGKFSRSTTKAKILNSESSRPGKAVLVFEVGGKTFRIIRTISEKKASTISFELLEDDKWITYVDVGDTKRDTDKTITKFFGTYDDLVFTNISTQDSINQVIGNNRLRKDVISRFLGLDIFEDCKNIANKERLVVENKLDSFIESSKKYNIGEIKVKISQLESTLNEKEEKERILQEQYSDLEKQTIQLESKCDNSLIDVDESKLQLQIESLIEKKKLSQTKIDSAPSIEASLKQKMNDLDDPEQQISELLKKINDLSVNKRNEIEKKTKDRLLKEKKEIVAPLIPILAEIDLQITEKQLKYQDLKTELVSAERSLDKANDKLANAEELSKSINDTICKGQGEYASCIYLVGAVEKKKLIPEIKKNISIILSTIESLQNELQLIEIELKNLKDKHLKVEGEYNQLISRVEFEINRDYETELSNLKTYLTEYNSELNKLREVQKSFNELKSKLDQIPLIVESEQKSLSIYTKEIDQLEIQLKKILEMKPIIEAIKVNQHQLRGMKNDLIFQKNMNSQLNEDLGLQKGLLITANELRGQIDQYENILKTYKLYLKAYSNDGIPHTLMKQVIPYIQNKVNSFLQLNDIDFNISIELDESDLELYLYKIQQGQKIQIDFCSGMEKTIVSIAFRCAYADINSLCKFNLFVIDEAFSTFDDDNILNITKIFDFLKKQFKLVMIISHLNRIKDYYDVTFNVRKTSEGSLIE